MRADRVADGAVLLAERRSLRAVLVNPLVADGAELVRFQVTALGDDDH
jgi:hypothetical protein